MTSGIDGINKLIKRLQLEINAIQELNRNIQRLIRLLAAGFRGAGFYTLQVSGEGGVANFKSKLENAQFKMKRKNPFPEIVLETDTQQKTVTNPVTGLQEIRNVTVMKPSLRPADSEDSSEPEILSANELSGLRYCGAVVFYGQANDSNGFGKLLEQYSVLETFGKSFLGNILGSGDPIGEKLRPFVHRVEVQNSQGDFVNAEGGEAKFNTRIKVVLKNKAHEINKAERDAFQDLQGRAVDFTPKVLVSTLNVTNSDEQVDTSSDVFSLYKGNAPDATTSIQLQPTFETELVEVRKLTDSGFEGISEEEFNIYIVVKDQALPASEDDSPSYKLNIKDSPMSSERLTLEKPYFSEVGFKVEKTSLLSMELNDAV